MKSILIEMCYPDSVSNAEIKDYCQEALEYWGGQRHPEDHLFYTTKAPKKHMRVMKSGAYKCSDCGVDMTAQTAFGREDGLYCDTCLEKRVDHSNA